jgi:hypothetical protein
MKSAMKIQSEPKPTRIAALVNVVLSIGVAITSFFVFAFAFGFSFAAMETSSVIVGSNHLEILANSVEAVSLFRYHNVAILIFFVCSVLIWVPPWQLRSIRGFFAIGLALSEVCLMLSLRFLGNQLLTYDTRSNGYKPNTVLSLLDSLSVTEGIFYLPVLRIVYDGKPIALLLYALGWGFALASIAYFIGGQFASRYRRLCGASEAQV